MCLQCRVALEVLFAHMDWAHKAIGVNDHVLPQCTFGGIPLRSYFIIKRHQLSHILHSSDTSSPDQPCLLAASFFQADIQVQVAVKSDLFTLGQHWDEIF